MRIFKLIESFILSGIIAAVIVALTPSLSMAPGGGGGGVEPGVGCGLEGVKYAAPPYMGKVTVVLGDENQALVTGYVEQVGKSECSGTFIGVNVGTYSSEEFKELKPSDLSPTCIQNICSLYWCPFPCVGEDGYLEVVAVGEFKRASDTEFTAVFIIMELE